jgi:hypothetical protein
MDKNNSSVIGKSNLNMRGNFWTELQISMGWHWIVSPVVKLYQHALFYCNLILICNTLCLFPLVKFWVYETQDESIVLSFCTCAHYDHWEACGAKVKIQALGATGDCWTHRVMMNHLYISLDHKLDYILTPNQGDSGEWCSEFIHWVRRQQWCLNSYPVFYHRD